MMRRARGFSLIELMVAILLFSLIAAAMAAIQEMALKRQSGSMDQDAAAGNASALGRVLRRELASISHIQTPTAPPPGQTRQTPTLTVWENANPGPGAETGNPLVAGRPRVFKHFCVQRVANGPPTQVRDDFYFYTNRNASGGATDVWPMPAISCGGAAPSGGQRIMLAGGVTGMSIAPAFTRTSNNALQVGYIVVMSPRGRRPVTINHVTQVNLRGALQ